MRCSALCSCLLYTSGGEAKLLKIATPHPFPEKLALSFLEGVDEVLVVEELSPVLEHALVHLVGKHHLKLTVLGNDVYKRQVLARGVCQQK